MSIVLLLLLSRPTEALEYGKSVYEAAIFYLPETLEQIYATELYASCLYGVGKIDEAREMFSKALRGIETEISEAEVLRDGIKANMDELKDYESSTSMKGVLLIVFYGEIVVC